ncbi:MAG: fructose-bisphosphatase [Desulfomicrobiaceae bacterium]|jgi:fructose-1,6-bisphosphatase I|nr:class 1 fructose-bisphosphatase [Desulfomicrobiaceae bacterium]MBZ4647785.1 fructose-bisphosphatase [Desulfomicrobiaceae bacterium]MBZ4684964.1 fructose-bisphosphatase [Desulfomicrobiaceae bacterium]MDI3492535.1 fructose,6-bisphosphatase [Desulfomicrobiaceae bacterium]MDK2872578.1 fructose,6-bisphosphatase [Desulfomicrobiaceae bacterium]
MRQVTTVVEHLLLQQKERPLASGRFTRLLTELILAAKIIDREVSKAGLLDVLGATGEVNVQGEMVQKLDDFANRVIIRRMERAGVLCAMVSEENADVIEIPHQYPEGDYILMFDPLDGSANIDANVSIGTIFSIYRRQGGSATGVTLSDVLQKGAMQVAAGYFIYGSSTMLVYTTGNGVHGFTLDPSVGEFLLSHPDIRIPEQGKIYSVNEGYTPYWDATTRKAVEYFRSCDNALGRPYSLRYIGSLVSDIHRNLIYGGIFLYPADCRDPKKPAGKLRLMCEANPMAMIVEQAGGMALDGRRRILDIEPDEIHQRTPLVIGSKNDVLAVQRIYAEADAEAQ